MTQVAPTDGQKIARPLKVLVPLIQVELREGERAGLEHYRRAGEMLIEAKDQMPWGNWQRWLTKNFKTGDGKALSRITAHRYMRLAELARENPEIVTQAKQLDYTALTSGRTSRQQVHGSWRPVVKAAKALDADLFAKERQKREQETRLRRELAIELIDLGYRALATRLHPDRGGSKDAMVRLNEIRDILKEIARTRSFA